MTQRLTDEELAELERLISRRWYHPWCQIEDKQAHEASYAALPSLLAEVRDLRKQAAAEEGDAEHLGEFCIAAADGVLMLLAAAENSRKALAKAQAEANELRSFKARVDAVINCDRCRFGIEWGELGDADACSKCGGLERAVKP